MGIPVLTVNGPTSGTYTANASANRIGVYLRGGGGNPGNGANCPDPAIFSPGGAGGSGGFGFYNKPIAQPFAQPYSVGAGGGNVTLTNVGTANTGGNGNPAPGCASGNAGTSGTAPGASLNLLPFGQFLIPAGGAQTACALVIFENTGT